jgi:hypothetical protein
LHHICALKDTDVCCLISLPPLNSVVWSRVVVLVVVVQVVRMLVLVLLVRLPNAVVLNL